jgi:integrase
MSDLKKIPVVSYWLHNAWIDSDGNPCSETTPGARFKEAFRVRSGTPGATPKKTLSRKWYARIDGKPVPLSANKGAAQMMLGELLKKAEMKKAGAVDAFEEHRQTTLCDHLESYVRYLAAKNVSERQVKQVRNRVLAILDGCSFVFPNDLNISRLQEFLAELQQQNKGLPPLPAGDWFTKTEAATALQISPAGFQAMVRRHKLEASGNGSARRYPRATVECLRQRGNRGRSIQTANHYLCEMKSFARWMVKDRRMPDNPLEHVSRGNVKLDRRHDRRPLSLDEIRLLIETARQSAWVFRELAGRDRSMLYAVACVSGFRAEELSELSPSSFDLGGNPPTVTLPATCTKNGRTAVQPLPPDILQELGDYLAARATDSPVWPGTWWANGAEMLRADLEGAGIPYIVEGADGPL